MAGLTRPFEGVLLHRMRPVLGPNHTLTEAAILWGSRKGHRIYEALEVVCKGPEVALPAGISFADKGGKVRHEVRVRWWQEAVPLLRLAEERFRN